MEVDAAAAGTDDDDDDRGELLTEAALFVCDDIILLGTIESEVKSNLDDNTTEIWCKKQ